METQLIFYLFWAHASTHESMRVRRAVFGEGGDDDMIQNNVSNGLSVSNP